MAGGSWGGLAMAFWPSDLDVYKRQIPPQRGPGTTRMLKVTSCERKCTPKKPEPGSAHDLQHIMTSPRYTGISRRDMQTIAPNASLGIMWTLMELPMYAITWWCHQMEILSALLALCEGNPPAMGEFPSQRPVTRRFNMFYILPEQMAE